MELGLALLLRAAWIAGTLPILLASIPSSLLSSFHGILLGFARRGKIMPSSSCHKFTVPQRFFLHFYVLAVVWTTILVLAAWFHAYKTAPLGSKSLHYSMVSSHLTDGHITSPGINLIPPLWHIDSGHSARMHIFGCLTGLFFYMAAPLSLCTFCAVEALNFAVDQLADFYVKGQDMMSIIDGDWWGYVKPITKLGWCQWTGVAIFFWGWLHQHRCHSILGSLRQDRQQTDEYVIPHGDWFEIVSSPHYLAEMIIYAGLLLASGGTDLTIWLLFGFVVANLSLAAAETQRWYLHKFEDYPRNRWAILPFIY